MQTLQDKIALVTGGGSGLGAATCAELADAGAKVIVADVREEAARAAAARLGERYPERAVPLRLDVSDAASSQEAIQRVVRDFGRLDILINNAGVDMTAPIGELSLAEWDRILAVNLRGPFLLSKLALDVMIPRRSGHIVNITSTAAKRAWANASAYHASKWGLLGLSHALHVEARQHGVKVTAVVAGGMRTPFLLERFPELDPNKLQDPRNVAATIRFALSQPAESVMAEVTVLPMQETSWP
jgi:NAD(P)-dependent dehydrogenase (short-subunit alcohol dehydrogenase family)